MKVPLGFWFLPCLGALGCGVQLTSGPQWAGRGRPHVAAITATGTLEALRRRNSIVAVRVNTVVSNGYRLRSTMLHGGYDFLSPSGRWALEPGLDLGAGKSVQRLFAGVGAYGGAAATLRFRPYPWTVEPSYNLAYPMLEFVLLSRAGFWMPPQGSGDTTVYIERGLEFGIRGTFGTDLATTGQGQVWDGGPECRDDRAGDAHATEGQHAIHAHGACSEENP